MGARTTGMATTGPGPGPVPGLVTTGTEEASSDVQVLLLERLMVVRITGRV